MRFSLNNKNRYMAQIRATEELLGHFVSDGRIGLVKSFGIIVFVMLFSGVSLGADLYEKLKAGEYKDKDVVIQVGFSRSLDLDTIFRMSCDGAMSVSNAGQSISTIRGTIHPDSVLTLVNNLLAINFFDLPAKYHSGFKQLVFIGGNKLAYLSTGLWDGGWVTVHLQVGPRKHTIVLRPPAHGAPDELLVWVEKVRELKDRIDGS